MYNNYDINLKEIDYFSNPQYINKVNYISGMTVEVSENINIDDTSANKKRRVDGETEVKTKAKDLHIFM